VSTDATSTNPFFGANNFDGLIIQDWPVELQEVTDGTSNTYMISERNYQIRAWMIGAYWRDASPVKVGKRVDGPQAVAALFAMKNLSDKVRLNHQPLTDGFYISHDNSMGDRPEKPSTVKGWVTVNDLPFASYHSGGVNFAMGDGGVRFVSESIDVPTYLAFGSRNGDDLVGQ
jgi:prepilin-type processing-associated H-X9-DG protein